MRFRRGLAFVVLLLIAATFAVRGWEPDCGHPTDADAGTGGAALGEAGTGDAADARPRRIPRQRAGDGGDAAAPDADATALTAPADDSEWRDRTHLIQGVVRLPDGSTVADALVTLGDLDDSDAATVSAADGTFGIDEIASYSSVQAAALRDGAIWTGSEKADGAPLDLVVTLTPPTGRDDLRLVHVVGWDGGRVDGAHATILRRGLRPGDRWRGKRIEVGGGWFAVRTTAARDGATPLFVVTGPIDADGRSLPYGPALVDGGRLTAPATEVRLPPGVSLTGRVVGPDGAPVVRAVVSLDPPHPEGLDATPATPWTEISYSDAAGRFAFGGLPRGRGRLSITPRDEFSRVTDREVDCGGDEIVVRLVASSGPTITVTDAAGRPLAEATVWCPGHRDVPTATTGPDGRARLSGLSVGVVAALAANHRDHVRTSVADWIAADTTVVLPADHPIRGVVVDVDGRPLPEATLVAERRRAASAGGWLAVYSDGTFTVADMAEGDEAELRLVDGPRVITRAVVAAGAQGVRLVWDDPARFGVAFERSDEDWRGGAAVTLRSAGDADPRDLASIVPHGAAAESRIVTFDATRLPPRVHVQVGPVANGAWAVLRDVPARGVVRVPRDAWRPGRAITGRVTGADGATPRGGATVIVSDGSGFVVRVRADDDGNYTVPGAPTAALTIRAESEDGSASAVHPADAGTDAIALDLSP